MRIYAAATVDYTRHVIDHGFVEGGHGCCEFRDDLDDVLIGGGAPGGDDWLVLSIDILGMDAFSYKVTETPLESDGPGLETGEVWLPADIANINRDTLVVYDKDGNEIDPDTIWPPGIHIDLG